MDTITVDRCQRTIRVTYAATAGARTIAAINEALLAMIDRHFGRDPDFVLLLDMSRCRMPPAEAMRAIGQSLSPLPPARRIAVVAEGTPGPATLRDDLRSFSQPDEAARWLAAA